ncbi:pantetheine-phosphate adenylyltransferase [Candidatus Poribacteria bacterium]|nr:pantetheine-phosphate adenylyltransferase [Candidatus Poribacteria bacterium]
MSQKTAIFPASFDPVTNGHVDLIDRICNLGIFDELIVAIGVNPEKPARFTLEERTEMLKTVIQPYPQATIDGYTGLTVHYAQARGACAIIRGLREISDFEWEFKMARMNQQIAPDIDTVFMMANTQYAHISSTLVMEVVQMAQQKLSEEKLQEMVPEIVIEFIKKKFNVL